MRRLVFVFLALTVAALANAQPDIDGAAVAAFADRPVTISGAGFGEPAPTSTLVLTQERDTRRIPSYAAEITNWTDRQIVVRMPGDGRRRRLPIQDAGGRRRQA